MPTLAGCFSIPMLSVSSLLPIRDPRANVWMPDTSASAMVCRYSAVFKRPASFDSTDRRLRRGSRASRSATRTTNGAIFTPRSAIAGVGLLQRFDERALNRFGQPPRLVPL